LHIDIGGQKPREEVIQMKRVVLLALCLMTFTACPKRSPVSPAENVYTGVWERVITWKASWSCDQPQALLYLNSDHTWKFTEAYSQCYGGPFEISGTYTERNSDRSGWDVVVDMHADRSNYRSVYEPQAGRTYYAYYNKAQDRLDAFFPGLYQSEYSFRWERRQ